ncbi:MAG TPA: prolipoprotein diacylglyceryl transferase [Acholeplasmataceae bacterium]|nr:prolipoprotein diacylglyceryl transferase [Acholeplasmataceae bacterium]
MKKIELTDKQKLWLKIGLTTLYFVVVFILVLSSMEKRTDSLGNEIIHFNQIAFSIFGRGIYFYAIAIITGIGIAYFYGAHIARKIGFSEDNLFDGFIMGTIIGILGARIYYAIFSWKEGGFDKDPLRVITGFFNEEGGLAIHGAVIAAAIFAYFFCKKRKEDIFKLGEMLFPGFFIGQIFGRWGNFFNKEAHGGPIRDTVLASREFLEKLPIPRFVVDQMYINGTYMHPTFLYESVWNLIGLILVITIRKKTKKYWYGDAVLFYMVWYGIGRFFVESLRTDALLFNFLGMELRIAQVVSILMIVAGITLFILRRIFKVKPVSFIELVEENRGVEA